MISKNLFDKNKNKNKIYLCIFVNRLLKIILLTCENRSFFILHK